jgi:hypothetical protein
MWRHVALAEEDGLSLPEVGIEFPVSELYDGIDFPKLLAGEE